LIIKKFILTLCIFIHFSVSVSSKIIQKNSKFIDEYGRSRIFHGVNIVYKLPPYIPSDDKFDPYLSFNDDDIAYMKKFGFNLVRLGVMWEAIESAPGVYDIELLNKYYNLVNKLGANGIYTIVDAHQDILSRNTCGEGIPTFYVESTKHDKDCNGNFLKQFLHLIGVCKSIDEYAYRKDEKGLPFIQDCKKINFAKYNMSPEISSLYDALYNNHDGLLDKFIAFWAIVAQKFKGNDYVLGYDLFNEPFPGGLFKDPISALLPGKPDNNQLLPFYRKIDIRLREIDDDYLMMFEPMPFPDLLPIFMFKFRGSFSEPPLNKNYNDKQMFNYHSYCCSYGFSVCATGEPLLDKAEYCRNNHFEMVQYANKIANKFNIGSIISEFGACFNTQACYNEISSLADAADQYLTSWAYWMYKPFNDFTTSCIDDKEGLFEKDGTIQEFKVKALTRTYVHAFQGDSISMKFDTESKYFITKFNLNPKIKEPTVIYLNKNMNYPNGYRLMSSKKSSIVDYSEENIIKLTFEGVNEEIVTIIITPKENTEIENEKEIKKFLKDKNVNLFEL
jgi:endoglycosylceramidase